MSIIEKALSKKRDGPDSPPQYQRSQQETVAAEAAGQSGYGVYAVGATGAVSGEDYGAESTSHTRSRVEISRERLAALGLLSPEGGRAQIAEEFRMVKRPLLKTAFAEGADAVVHGNLIMVTSALPREGKSFSTINLAMSIAMEFDRTVLLVDADVAHPCILEYLGVEDGRPGLLDILARDDIDFPDALIRTDIDNLTLLPAGRTSPRANEMLASKGMEDLVREMSERYPDRVILFDTPPLLATSEASVLATHMGQVVFVVESDNTPQDAATRAIEQIHSCKHVWPLLNKSKPLPGMRYAYGYYGSYYGYGT